MKRDHSKPANDLVFLPDFCHVQMVLSVVIIGQLLAFLLVLAPFGNPQAFWDQLSLISLVVQLVGLSSIWLLCRLRPLFQHMSDQRVFLVSILVFLSITALFTEMAVWLPWIIGLSGSPPHSWHVTKLLHNLGIAAIVSFVALRYFYLQHQWKLQVQGETRARLDALQARIRPHFLFNSMNTIASLISSHPQQAEEAIEDLADLFRHNLSEMSQLATIAQEFDITRRYLSMEKLRLSDRLNIEWDVDSVPEDFELPVLIIQPLVENAIYHGIEPIAEGGTIRIEGKISDDSVTIYITNPVKLDSQITTSGNRIALENIQHRLQALYGSSASIGHEQKGNTYVVTLKLPREASA